MSDETLPLLQGTLDILVLKALAPEPMHGYAVARWIRETTDDALQIEEGALYTALHRLEKKGLIKGGWGLTDTGRRARFYTLTKKGSQTLQKETARWEEHAGAVFSILEYAGETKP